MIGIVGLWAGAACPVDAAVAVLIHPVAALGQTGTHRCVLVVAVAAAVPRIVDAVGVGVLVGETVTILVHAVVPDLVGRREDGGVGIVTVSGCRDIAGDEATVGGGGGGIAKAVAIPIRVPEAGVAAVAVLIDAVGA